MILAEISFVAQFGDVDAMGVLWHGHYARFLEQARDALMEAIGYGYSEMHASGFMWPIVELQVKYVRPVSLGQRVRVEARLLEYENRLKIAYRCLDASDGALLTKAHSVQVAVSVDTRELRLESPQALIERVEALL